MGRRRNREGESNQDWNARVILMVLRVLDRPEIMAGILGAHPGVSELRPLHAKLRRRKTGEARSERGPWDGAPVGARGRELPRREELVQASA